MGFFNEPKKVEKKQEIDFRPSYKEIRSCVLKKEIGEPTEECKKILNKISKED